MNVASYIKRGGKYAVDFVFAALFPAAALVYVFYYAHYLLNIPPLFLALILLASQWLSFTIINTLWMFTSNGRTLGSHIFGVRIVRQNFKRLSFGDCFARNIGEGLIIMMIVNWIYMIAVGTEKSIFDRITNTVIVDWRNRTI